MKLSAKQKKIGSLILFIALVFFVQGIGSFAMGDQVSTWYKTLNRPSFTPPNYVFGPVWTILYFLIGVSIWYVYQAKSEFSKIKAYVFFGLQLFANMIWSILFFAMQNPKLALVDILILWILILMTMNNFYLHSKKGAICLIPYLLWVTYAVALNAAFVVLNP
jgi:tryptophan-rich sensory protein